MSKHYKWRYHEKCEIVVSTIPVGHQIEATHMGGEPRTYVCRNWEDYQSKGIKLFQIEVWLNMNMNMITFPGKYC